MVLEWWAEDVEDTLMSSHFQIALIGTLFNQISKLPHHLPVIKVGLSHSHHIKKKERKRKRKNIHSIRMPVCVWWMPTPCANLALERGKKTSIHTCNIHKSSFIHIGSLLHCSTSSVSSKGTTIVWSLMTGGTLTLSAGSTVSILSPNYILPNMPCWHPRKRRQVLTCIF